MNEHELISKLAGQLRECAGWDGDTNSQDSKKALDYYFQRPRGDEVRGRSNVVSGDISSMVEANLAQMLDAFSHAAIAEFDADGPEDDDQAALESFAVVQAVMKDNNGYQAIGTAVKDGLLVRNGWIKVWVTEKEHVETITLEGATAEAIAELRAKPGLEVELQAFDDEKRVAEDNQAISF